MDAQYSPIPAGSLLEKTLTAQRRRLFDAFMDFKKSAADGTILEVGAMPSAMLEGADYLTEWIDTGSRSQITSCRIVSQTSKAAAYSDASHIYRKVDSRQLPYADGEFDWVFCNETIERAGSLERQYELLKELMRVSRKGVFVTTSNRWYPMEFNTARPFLHWLPDATWRRVLKLSGKGRWASEAALNLLDAKGLQKLTSLLPGQPTGQIGHVRFFGLKAYFFLMIKKSATKQT